MVHLKFYRQEDFVEVNYALDSLQSEFTVTAKFALERIKTRKTGLEYPITIFFVLDFGKDKFDITSNQNAVLFRALSVNPSMQGQGIGKQVMTDVEDFICENFEDCDEIVLAVNQYNISALKLYLNSGYQLDSKTKVGRSGLQYLMRKKLC